MEGKEEAVEFYRAAIIDAFLEFALDNDPNGQEFAVPLNDLLECWPESESANSKVLMDFDLDILEVAIRKIEKEDGIQCFKEKYADVVLYTEELQNVIISGKNCKPYIQKQRLGYRGKGWLTEALIRISEETRSDRTTKRADAFDSDTDWQPLPIEREDPLFIEAIKAVEEALETIEQDNGYAAHYPEERVAILDPAKATLKAAKEGEVTEDQIRINWIKPFKYLIKKFGDSIIGVVAKKAATAILAWLESML